MHLLPSLGKRSKNTLNEYNMEDGEIESSNLFIQREREVRMKYILKQLQGLCTTQEARTSLWEWQLLFARKQKVEALLPPGGKMKDDKGGWVSRMGRAIIGGG